MSFGLGSWHNIDGGFDRFSYQTFSDHYRGITRSLSRIKAITIKESYHHFLNLELKNLTQSQPNKEEWS